MPVKKTTDKVDENEKVVSVTVPAQQGIALNDIYKAALTSVRNEIPLRSDLVYDVLGTEKNKEKNERTYQVRISWGPHDQPATESDPRDGDFVSQQLESLEVPRVMPGDTGNDPAA